MGHGDWGQEEAGQRRTFRLTLNGDHGRSTQRLRDGLMCTETRVCVANRLRNGGGAGGTQRRVTFHSDH